MANNYVQMSEEYDLSDEQVVWFKDFLALCEKFDELNLDNDKPQIDRLANILSVNLSENKYGMGDLEDAVRGAGAFELNQDEKVVWINGDEYVDIDVVLAVLQAMLSETKDSRVLTGTWAETCSKPRIGEFGGGWYAVSATESKGGNTWDAAAKAAKAMKESA